MNFKDKAQQNLATAFSYDLRVGRGYIQYMQYTNSNSKYFIHEEGQRLIFYKGS
jgi:hypothetical protein